MLGSLGYLDSAAVHRVFSEFLMCRLSVLTTMELKMGSVGCFPDGTCTWNKFLEFVLMGSKGFLASFSYYRVERSHCALYDVPVIRDGSATKP
ncbi:hypothetical protein OUZ56_016100 [Daphnia magna]|uniref:Uncharacterized protein n=1 Tax=Daphnia magna TaxID=35525 RepID=A0ABR0APL1_9CRUS|nr:hypothetical protein OUZ56_016100 [Daphnia magna]